jgi:hypothetical protein
VIYYWRIDTIGINGTQTATSVWSFRVEALPDKAINPVPTDTATGIASGGATALSWTQGAGDPDDWDVFIGTDFTDVDNATTSDPEYLGNVGVTNTTAPTVFGTTYYWRVDTNGTSGTEKGDVWQFSTELPLKAVSEDPADTATAVDVDKDLGWASGGFTNTYDVYFGTTPTPGGPEFQGNQGTTSFEPGTMSPFSVYYWRIDSRNDLGVTTGDVWSFTTGDPAALIPTSIDVEGVGSEGGGKIVLSGPFADQAGLQYDVYIGTTASPTDPKGLSGEPDQPHRVTCGPESIEFYAPALDPGVYSITLIRSDLNRVIRANKALIVAPEQYKSTVLESRRVLPSYYKTGPRNSQALPEAVVAPDLSPLAPVLTGPIADAATVISGTAQNDFATVTIYADSVEIGTATVTNQVWTAIVPPVSTGETIDVIARNTGGTSPNSNQVVVS